MSRFYFTKRCTYPYLAITVGPSVRPFGQPSFIRLMDPIEGWQLFLIGGHPINHATCTACSSCPSQSIQVMIIFFFISYPFVAVALIKAFKFWFVFSFSFPLGIKRASRCTSVQKTKNGEKEEKKMIIITSQIWKASNRELLQDMFSKLNFLPNISSEGLHPSSLSPWTII